VIVRKPKPATLAPRETMAVRVKKDDRVMLFP
jgi:hypothetical protein